MVFEQSFLLALKSNLLPDAQRDCDEVYCVENPVISQLAFPNPQLCLLSSRCPFPLEIRNRENRWG